MTDREEIKDALRRLETVDDIISRITNKSIGKLYNGNLLEALHRIKLAENNLEEFIERDSNDNFSDIRRLRSDSEGT